MAAPVQHHSVELSIKQPETKASGLDEIKKVVGVALAILGLAILVGTAFTLAGHLIGSIVVSTEAVHTFFMTGILATVGGFHLAKGNGSAEIDVGGIKLELS